MCDRRWAAQEGLREELRRQIAPAEVVIALSSLYPQQQDLLVFQLNYAKASDKPVLLLPHFGIEQPRAKALLGLFDETGVVGRAGAGGCGEAPGAA